MLKTTAVTWAVADSTDSTKSISVVKAEGGMQCSLAILYY